MQGRRRKESTNILQKLGYMMVMTPFVMQVRCSREIARDSSRPEKNHGRLTFSLLQILSLPGAIASIKMSLLRSLMVAQLAIAIMFYNLIKSTGNSDVVVVHQPQHLAHHYHRYHPDDEDEWFGR